MGQMTAHDVYAGLEPPELWRHFAGLNSTPRRSGQETAARAYVQGVADATGCSWEVDGYGNLVVRVPAKSGRQGAAAVAVQAHLDMLCEKRPGVEHDFDRDPIRPRIVDGRVYATGTTLGADNGIGAAAAIALMTAPGLKHGPLELIFTREEETGLDGAMALDPSLVRARLLINLDSEDPDELTVGCAGGAGTILKLPVQTEPAPPGWVGREVVVTGLKGGHSGVQIHEPLANAIKLLAGVLPRIEEAGIPFRIASGSLHGGSAHNAIPRDASAIVALSPRALAPGTFHALERAVEGLRAALLEEWGKDEPGLALEVREIPPPGRVFREAENSRILSLLHDLPHGVLKWSDAFPGKVETSSNLAQLRTGEDVVEVCTSSRSFVAAELASVQQRIRSLGEATGAIIEARDSYPGWQPDRNSRLLEISKRVYEQVMGKAPEVQVVHAGLECGAIVSKLPGMEAISFGPLIRGAHTPEEHVTISTVGATWKILIRLVETLAC
jgi:dipeptidase D